MRTRVFGLWVAAFLSVAAFGQGTFLFNTFIPGSVDARWSDWTGAGLGAGWTKSDGRWGDWTAQMFLVTGAGANTTYTPLVPTTTFRTSSAAAAYYVVPPEAPVVVPGLPPGAQATLVMRGWFNLRYDFANNIWIEAGYDDAVVKAQSSSITIVLGGLPPGGGAPIPDAILMGLQGVSFVPEPSTMAVAGLGMALLFWRRKWSFHGERI